MTHSLLNQAAEKKTPSADQYFEVGFGSSALSMKFCNVKERLSSRYEDVLRDMTTRLNEDIGIETPATNEIKREASLASNIAH